MRSERFSRFATWQFNSPISTSSTTCRSRCISDSYLAARTASGAAVFRCFRSFSTAVAIAVRKYNKAATNKGTPDKFGFVATNTDAAPMTEGPWYACPKVPTVHHTMGGIRINVHAQVLNKKGSPVKGLYAAGEVTGGIHGANRLGGNAIAHVYTFGKVAGESAAKKL